MNGNHIPKVLKTEASSWRQATRSASEESGEAQRQDIVVIDAREWASLVGVGEDVDLELDLPVTAEAALRLQEESGLSGGPTAWPGRSGWFAAREALADARPCYSGGKSRPGRSKS